MTLSERIVIASDNHNSTRTNIKSRIQAIRSKIASSRGFVVMPDHEEVKTKQLVGGQVVALRRYSDAPQYQSSMPAIQESTLEIELPVLSGRRSI